MDTLDPLAVPALEALRMGTEYGAKALGIEKLGRLEEGFKADITLFDTNSAAWCPQHDLLSLLVYSANSSSVDSVMIDGKLVMEKGHLIEEGKHDELVAAGGRYAQMWNHYTEAIGWKISGKAV